MIRLICLILCGLAHAKNIAVDNVMINANDLTNSTCQTNICVKESFFIRNKIDETINPCDDFYDFACGKFIRDTVLTNHMSSKTLFSTLQSRVNDQVNTILTETIQSNESKPFKLAKIFYKSCMDESLLEARGESFFSSLFFASKVFLTEFFAQFFFK